MLGGGVLATRDDLAEGRLPKEAWPAAEMAERFDRLWRGKTGVPLQIVGGDNWTADTAALLAADHPSLFSYLDPAHSPQMTDERVGGRGMLDLWTSHSSWQPTQELVSRYPHGSETFIVAESSKVPPLVIDYLIVAPGRWLP